MQLIKSIYDSFHISFPTMKVAGYFKLMLSGTYTIIVFECRTHSSLKWPPPMIQINLLALDTVKVTTEHAQHSEFRPMTEVSFPELVSPANAKEKIPLLSLQEV